MTGSPPLFDAVQVVRVYRSGSGAAIRALDGVSLAVPRGSFQVVEGPSGGGKTTLLALLAALDRPTGGTVRYDSLDLVRASEAERSRVRRRLGLILQHSPMIPGLALWENVTYPLVPRGAGATARRRIAAEWLERLGIRGREHARPEELSAGELRRAGVARAMAGDPEALVADEPTAELDRESADAVVAMLASAHAAGRTVVVATHDPALRALATAVCRLREGRREA